jgi:hypothetical protein
MGKYEPLTQYLQNQPVEIWEARFSDVESVLGFPLPRSAHEYPAWWANQQPGHSQTRGWQDAGWETGQVDLSAKKVRFTRRQRPTSQQVASETATSTSAASNLADLWRRASEISEITDRMELERAALHCFIESEAGRQLAEMGGTMPDIELPPRRRIVW